MIKYYKTVHLPRLASEIKLVRNCVRKDQVAIFCYTKDELEALDHMLHYQCVLRVDALIGELITELYE